MSQIIHKSTANSKLFFPVSPSFFFFFNLDYLKWPVQQLVFFPAVLIVLPKILLCLTEIEWTDLHHQQYQTLEGPWHTLQFQWPNHWPKKTFSPIFHSLQNYLETSIPITNTILGSRCMVYLGFCSQADPKALQQWTTFSFVTTALPTQPSNLCI